MIGNWNIAEALAIWTAIIGGGLLMVAGAVCIFSHAINLLQSSVG